MRIKHLISVLMIICMISALAACNPHTGNPGEPVSTNDLPAKEGLAIPVSSDFFLLCCENSDFTIDFSRSYSRDVCYQLISAFPITPECTCSIVFDKDVSYTITISEAYETGIADDVSLLTYVGIDWVNIAADLRQCTTKTEADALLKDKGVDPAPKVNEAVKLYSTYVIISFAECHEDIELTALTMTVNGISKQYDIGSIRLIPGDACEMNTALCINSICLSDVPATVCKEGFFSSFDIETDINDDVILKEVVLSTKSAKLKDVQIQIMKGEGTVVTRRLSQDTVINLEKGDKIVFELSTVYNADNSKGVANGQFTVIINFEANGKEGYDFAEIIYRARFADVFQYYVSNELGLDISSYWTEYLPALTSISN